MIMMNLKCSDISSKKDFHLPCWEVKGLSPVLYGHSSECHWKCSPCACSVNVFADPNLQWFLFRENWRHSNSRRAHHLTWSFQHLDDWLPSQEKVCIDVCSNKVYCNPFFLKKWEEEFKFENLHQLTPWCRCQKQSWTYLIKQKPKLYVDNRNMKIM